MPECARCGAFTDNAAEGDYRYCDECLDRFAAVRQDGVIVEEQAAGDGYQVFVTADSNRYDGGTEPTQTDSLARGQYLCDELGVDGLFRYQSSGSQWLLNEYLEAHPKIRQDVQERLSRVPERTDDGLLDRLRGLF